MGAVPLETTLRYMKRMRDMSDRYDRIYNGHHDFRALGAPLDDDCLPTVIELMEEALAGHIVPCEAPSFWGQSIPLTKEREDVMKNAPKMFADAEKVRPPHRRIMLRKGRKVTGFPERTYPSRFRYHSRKSRLLSGAGFLRAIL